MLHMPKVQVASSTAQSIAYIHQLSNTWDICSIALSTQGNPSRLEQFACKDGSFDYGACMPTSAKREQLRINHCLDAWELNGM